MEGHTVAAGDLYRLLSADILLARRIASCPCQLPGPPLPDIGGGRQRPVVLQKLAEADQYLSQVQNLGDMGLESRLNGAGIAATHRHPFQNVAVGVEADHIAVQEPHRWPLNGAYRRHCSRLSRLLHLDLGSRRHELAQEQHGGWIDPGRGKAGIPGPAIAQPEAPRSGGMGEYGTAGDEVAQELGAGVPTILLGFGQAVQPLPSRDLKLGDMLLELGPLQGDPLRRDQGDAAPDPVGLNPGQVPVS